MKIYFYITRILYSLIFLQSFQLCLFSQPNLEWAQEYNGPGNGSDQSSSIAVDDSGNVYVTGSSSGGSGFGLDYATVKYNSAGIQQWASRYNGPGNGEDYAVAIKVDKSGNIYVFGSSKGIGTNNLDFATVKYNRSGVEQWAVRYNSGSSNENAKAMCIDSSGFIYVTGYNANLITIKYDSSGAQKWISLYDGPSTGSNVPNAIINDRFGNVLVTGSGDSDYLTIKYNTAGAQNWVATYNGPSNASDNSRSVSTDLEGNVFITGTSYSATPDWATIKYSPDGNQIWVVRNQRSLPESYDFARDIYTDCNGNVYVTGSQTDVIKVGSYITTKKYTPNGLLEWSKNFDRSIAEYGLKIIPDRFSNLTVLCISSYNFIILKYNTAGQLLWNETYSNIIPQAYAGIAADNSDNLLITCTVSDIVSVNYKTIKYSQIITGVIPISNELPDIFSLSQNYPNPFNPYTNIKFSIPKSGKAELRVHDAKGSEMKVLLNENLNAGSYEYRFDAASLPSGVYYYTLRTMEFTASKKMLLIK